MACHLLQVTGLLDGMAFSKCVKSDVVLLYWRGSEVRPLAKGGEKWAESRWW